MKSLNFLTLKMAAALSLATLAACTGLNLGTAGMLQSVDVFKDDISEMSFAIDVPLSVLPQDQGMIYKLDATTRQLGERHVVAVLERGGRYFVFCRAGRTGKKSHLSFVFIF